MKRQGIYTALLLVMLSGGNVLACEVCKKSQPEVLREVSHGTGAEANFDYVIIWSAAVVVAITLYLSIRYLVRPNEGAKDHIKNIVVENQY